MKKRIVTLLLGAALLLALSTATALTYELRQKGQSDTARVVTLGKALERTQVQYIDLKKPVAIYTAVSPQQPALGTLLAVDYTTSNKGSQTTQYFYKCDSLQLTSQSWPSLVISGNVGFPVRINKGQLADATLAGYAITLDGVHINGEISIPAGGNVQMNNCTFGEAARIYIEEGGSAFIDGNPVIVLPDEATAP